ncbi:MAG: hypothetical protein IJG18_11855 [Kiritimatiellae bacterium]|nr:hypothetical protein [Kiritimatiellia bacterium]
MKKVKVLLPLCMAATVFFALAFANNVVAIFNWWSSFIAAGGDSSAFAAKASGFIPWLDWAVVDYSAVTTFIPMLGFLCMTLSLSRMLACRRARAGDFPFFRGSDQLNVALGLLGTLWGIIVIGYFKLDTVTMADLMQCLHTALFSTLAAVVWVFLIDRPLVRPYFTRLLEETGLAETDDGDLAAAVDRLVVRLGAASDAFEKRQQEFEAEFRKRLDDYAAEASRRAAADAAEFEKRRGEYAAHFEKRLSDYEQSFETRQKEYVEFFKREIEALERRAKAADEARVETEARLAKIAAALRG